MADSKHLPADENGARLQDAATGDREIGVSGLPRAKLFYMTSGYGFGQRPADNGRERSASPAP